MKKTAFALKALGALGALVALCAGTANAQAQGATCPPTASYSPALFAKAEQLASDRGFLWRIERDGRASYLYGSLHVGKAEWMSPGPAVRAALGQVDALALEVDMSSDETQKQLQQVKNRPPRAIPSALQARLQRLWVAECLPLAQLSNGPVELQAAGLVALLGRRQGFDPAYSSELVLTIAAQAGKLPVVSLESLALQLDLLTAETDAQAEEMVSTMLEQIEDANARATLIKLIGAWEHNDLGVLAGYWDWCDCVVTERDRTDMKKLLDDRNPGLADGIESLHAGGQRVFAAVGALHMTGPMALPRLLTARGFKVERVY